MADMMAVIICRIKTGRYAESKLHSPGGTEPSRSIRAAVMLPGLRRSFFLSCSSVVTASNVLTGMPVPVLLRIVLPISLSG